MSETLKDLLVGLVPITVALIGIFGTVISGNKKTIAKVDKIEKKLDEHTKKEDFKHAKECREKIVRFDEEICRGMQHTIANYEEILTDIDDYEDFCKREESNGFHNGKGQLDMAHIKATYQKDKETNNFLKQELNS